MLSYTVTTSLVLLGLVLTWISIFFVNRLWPMEKRKPCNEVIGWQLTVLGTTYAVILGFMIYNVWTEFRTTSVDVSNEASAVLEVFRMADTLPDTSKARVQELVRRYAQQAIQIDWPDMATYQSSHLPRDGVNSISALWHELNAAKLQELSTHADYDQFRTALIHLERERNTREEQYRSHMPLGLWLLLLSGALLVVGSSCFLGHDKSWLHYIQVLSLTFTILVTLAAIADIDHPFAGSVHVSPSAFIDALDVMGTQKSDPSTDTRTSVPGRVHEERPLSPQARSSASNTHPFHFIAASAH